MASRSCNQSEAFFQFALLKDALSRCEWESRREGKIGQRTGVDVCVFVAQWRRRGTFIKNSWRSPLLVVFSCRSTRNKRATADWLQPLNLLRALLFLNKWVVFVLQKLQHQQRFLRTILIILLDGKSCLFLGILKNHMIFGGTWVFCFEIRFWVMMGLSILLKSLFWFMMGL